MEQTIKIDNYILADIDDSAYPRYYGFINNESDWYIMRENSDRSIRFFRVSFRSQGLYGQYWQNRTTLIYNFWDARIQAN